MARYILLKGSATEVLQTTKLNEDILGEKYKSMRGLSRQVLAEAAQQIRAVFGYKLVKAPKELFPQTRFKDGYYLVNDSPSGREKHIMSSTSQYLRHQQWFSLAQWDFWAFVFFCPIFTAFAFMYYLRSPPTRPARRRQARAAGPPHGVSGLRVQLEPRQLEPQAGGAAAGGALDAAGPGEHAGGAATGVWTRRVGRRVRHVRQAALPHQGEGRGRGRRVGSRQRAELRPSRVARSGAAADRVLHPRGSGRLRGRRPPPRAYGRRLCECARGRDRSGLIHELAMQRVRSDLYGLVMSYFELEYRWLLCGYGRPRHPGPRADSSILRGEGVSSTKELNCIHFFSWN